jgi:hypothetical protein
MLLAWQVLLMLANTGTSRRVPTAFAAPAPTASNSPGTSSTFVRPRDIGVGPRRQRSTAAAILERWMATQVLIAKGERGMARKAKKKRKYSRSSGRDVESEMRRYKKGTAKSGRGGKGGKVKSRKQAIAIGLSKARKKGKKVPKKKS